MRRSLLGLGLLLVACRVDGSSTPNTSTPIDTADWPEAWAAMEDEVLDLVNQNRWFGAVCGDVEKAGGQEALEADDVLRGVARAHSADMASRGFFDHVNPDGLDPFQRMAAAGFAGAQPWGENIAGGSDTAADVVQQWMNSPGHCENIMEPDYRVLGVGYAFDASSDLRHYWTQDFAGSH